MVQFRPRHLPIFAQLSVLALSSRFDGPLMPQVISNSPKAFSTRSVESF